MQGQPKHWTALFLMDDWAFSRAGTPVVCTHVLARACESALGAGCIVLRMYISELNDECPVLTHDLPRWLQCGTVPIISHLQADNAHLLFPSDTLQEEMPWYIAMWCSQHSTQDFGSQSLQAHRRQRASTPLLPQSMLMPYKRRSETQNNPGLCSRVQVEKLDAEQLEVAIQERTKPLIIE